MNLFTRRSILIDGTLDDEADRAAMAGEEKKSSYARSVKSLQENVTQAAPAMAAAYSLVGAILLFGAVGYGLDRWLGTSWFLVGGLALGVVVGFYELIKTTYRK
ncbi:MAG TPA: AtpZ/AtpI family protein [Vicinamibacterales bacterium]|nr:AtpZ/AtpI family protein [Vicinamibacterales bacterium]